MLYFGETITGVASSTVYGQGITSIQGQQYRLTGLIYVVSAQAANILGGWLEREQMINVIDHLVSIFSSGDWNEMPMALDIPVGQTFRASLTCGSTASAISVLYKYEVI